jgi:hypothetical protein
VRYTFLLTFPSFTTAHELLERLEARYHVPMPPNLTPAEMALQIESRIAPIQIKVGAAAAARGCAALTWRARGSCWAC